MRRDCLSSVNIYTPLMCGSCLQTMKTILEKPFCVKHSSALDDSDWLSVALTGSRMYMLHINLENHERGDVLELEPCGKPPKKPINNSFLLGTLTGHATFYVYLYFLFDSFISHK